MKGLQLGVLAVAVSGAVSALAAPANDPFANAIPIAGLTGQITGTNDSATLEVGEPSLVSTTTTFPAPVGASVWYQWTASIDGNITFDTIGSDFDTVLAVYTGAVVNSLTPVTADDDGGGNSTSRLTFTAVQGTTYYISVNGFDFGPPDEGDFVLNWNGLGSLQGGQFRLTSADYTYSQNESALPLNTAMTFVPARATVTRVRGYSGKVNVGYTLTNTFYTNIYCTNFFGTIDTNNVMTSNSAVRLTYQNYNGGFFSQTVDLPGRTTTYTNKLLLSVSNNVVFTNAPFCTVSNNFPPVYVANNPPPVERNFCYTVYGTNYLPTAIIPAGLRQGTLAFNDWQMSADISIPASVPGFAGVNGLVIVNLNSAVLDPAEDQSLPPPSVSTGNSFVTFLNTSGIDPSQAGLNPTTNTVFNFERATLRCTEGVNIARVAVTRTGTNFSQTATVHYVVDTFYPPQAGMRGANNLFALQPSSDYATPDDATKYSANVDFNNVSGTLTWGPFDNAPKFIQIPIIDDNLVEFNEDIFVEFDRNLPANGPTGGVYGNQTTCSLTVLFDSRLASLPDGAGNWPSGEQPAGALDRAHNPDNWPTTPPANQNQHPGANGTVYAVAVQADSKTLIAGEFTAYDTTVRNSIARVKFNGLLDTTFDPGSGANSFITSLLLQTSGKIVIGGGFTSFNGTLRNRIARLNSDGSLDGTFDPAFGSDGTIWSLQEQPDGKILIAGEFTSINLTNRAFVARLNANGTLDDTFDPGAGPDGIVETISLQTDGRVVIAGDFLNVSGVNRSHIARLNADGTLDTTFDPGFGADDVVYSSVVQADGRILLGGAFSKVGLLGGRGIARLNGDGSVDTSFDVGIGADDVVYKIGLQPDGKILVGGIFKSINLSRRISFARLYADGPVDTTFMDTAYNQFAGLVNPYFDPNVNAPNPIYDTGVQADGNIIIGGSFSQVGGGMTRDDIRPRSNVARLIGGATPGSGNIELAANYSADAGSTSYFITLSRTNGTLGAASAQIEAVPLAPGPGAAVYGVDYTFNVATPTWQSSWATTWMLSDGLSGPNNDEVSIDGTHTLGVGIGLNPVLLTVLSNNNPNATLNLALTQPIGTETFLLGGVNIPLGVALGRSLAPLTIVHNNTRPGVISFSSPTYTVNENGVNAVISVIRSGGSDGTVTVKYKTTTSTNNTAQAGVDYTAVNGTLSFFAGQTNKTFNVPITDNIFAQPDRTVGLSLFNVTGGATLGNTNGQLVIVDNDFGPGHVSFTVGTNGINENAGPALITVNRLGGSISTLGVTVATIGGTAVNGVNYAGFTNVLTWLNGDIAAKTISMPIFNDGVVTSNLTVNLRLRNGTVNGTNQPLVLGGIYTNAVVVITNTDAIGKVQFSAASYTFNENGGVAIIPVVRTGGSAQTISVNYAAFNGTAVDGSDFTATNGLLVFGPGEVAKLIRVSVINNGTVDPARFVALTLSSAAPTNALGSPSAAVLTLTDDESINQPPGQPDTSYSALAGFNAAVYSLTLQSDGSLLAGGDFTLANGVPRNRVAWLKVDGTLDSKFSSYLSSYGANATVRSIVVQSDQRILVAGFFTNFNSVVLNRIARLNFNGTLDSSFNPGAGANNPIYSMAETFVSGQRRIVLGGAFSTINGLSRNGVAQLLDSGALDANFTPGTGANGAVYAVAVQADGRIVIGGDFTAFNGTAINHVARLNADGSLDASFAPGTGADDSVRAIAIQLDGRILIGGLFATVNGASLSHIARLNATGSVDASFTPGVGANDNIEAIAVQSDARIVVAGDFTQCSGVTRSRITRLNPDGTVDPTINFGTGADSFIAAAAIQTDGSILLGGGFSNFNDEPHAHLVKVYGGSVAGSGNLEFVTQTYQADEIGSTAVITVRRTGGTSGPNADGSGNISVHFETSNDTAVAGVNYGTIATDLVFPPGEVFQSVAVPLMDDGIITPDLTVNLTLSNPTAPAGIGSQHPATLRIINNDSGISLTSSTYSIPKNTVNGTATIGIVRQGGTNGSASVVFMTTTNGSAVAGTDYLSVSNLVLFVPGDVSKTVTIPVINNGLPQGNRTVMLLLTNAVDISSNGASLLLLTPSQATLTIIDTVQAPGQVTFSATNYVFTEGNSNAVITVLRTNGTSGTISVGYQTVPGTAAPGLNYTAVSSTLTFGSGETVKTFNVPLLENSVAQGPVTLSLVLTNPTGGATIMAPSTVPMTILDNDTGIAFSSAAYVVNETNGSVTLNVLRLNNAGGAVQVSYATTNGSAVANTNYLTTSGTLTFNPGETNKSVTIPILHDLRATSNLTFAVNLFNPTAGAQLVFPSSASVIVLDAEAGIGFTNATFTVLKNGTNAVLTVFCSNPNVEPLFVNYASADGTATAGVDYGAVSGVLSFTNGAVTNYIIVPIINNSLIQGDVNFTVALSSPTQPGRLVAPSTATVTIQDINAGLSFSSPTYTVFKNGVSATIGVVRTGFTNNTVSVNYATQNGTAISGVDYAAVSGTLVFTNGQTNLSFSIPVTDSTTVQPDKTVLLQLSNPVGTNGVLATPSAAVLTIRDNSGSLVLAAGTALLTESGPVNGVIDPSETVSLLFALRNGGGTNTANLTATLLATNGISSPNAAQNYGSLVVNGPSASRQYSFIANGSNGQAIVATFLLTNGTVSAGSVSFTFALGSTSSAFTNSGAIILPLQGAAAPYPSTLNVSGVGGSLTKATVTFNKLTHTSPDDVDALLVSPTGQKMLLMANAGGLNAVNGVTLTFDDAAATYLPDSTQIVSGTNKPSPYFPVTVFPATAPAAPYATNLATFNGSNPNGTWSLYVLDDAALNSGMISNGWSMNLTAVNLVGSTADLVTTMTASNSVIVSNNLTYTLTVTNYGPSTATGVSLSDTLPGSVSLVSSNASLGGVSVVSGQVTWSVGTLPINTGASLTLVVKPSAVGSLTNSCYVQGNESDPNLVNNAATAITTVDSIKADLVLSMVGAPNPLYNGNNVTYTITVTNAGPATAPGVTVTNTLPPSVIFVSASPAGYVVSGGVVAFTNLGSVVVGGQTVATIVVKTTTGGTITNTAFTASLVTDPFKANNSATVKTVVDLLQLAAVRNGAGLVISWATNTPGYVLESATNLAPPVVWTTVVSPAPVVSSGQFVVTNTIGSGTKFFRLHGP